MKAYFQSSPLSVSLARRSIQLGCWVVAEPNLTHLYQARSGKPVTRTRHAEGSDRVSWKASLAVFPTTRARQGLLESFQAREGCSPASDPADLMLMLLAPPVDGAPVGQLAVSGDYAIQVRLSSLAWGEKNSQKAEGVGGQTDRHDKPGQGRASRGVRGHDDADLDDSEH